MTLLSTAATITHPVSAPTTIFSVPFKFLADEDLIVTKVVGGVATVLGLGAGYTVTGAGLAAGGSVTTLVAVQAGESIKIDRLVAFTQPTSLRAQGSFSPATHEEAFDRLAMQVQQIKDGVVNSSPVAYLASTTVLAAGSSSARRLEDRFSDSINVLDYGADRTGVVDCWNAVQAAINAATAYAGTASTASEARKRVYFPAGKYKLGTSLSIGAYTTLCGDRAVIQLDAGATGVTATGYQNRIEGLVVLGGAIGVYVNTGNVDTCRVHIEDCEFQDQTANAIKFSADSASTQALIKGCKFYNVNAAAVQVLAITGDFVHIMYCWATCAGAFAQVGDATHVNSCSMEVTGLKAIPAANTAWFVNYGNLDVHDSRFGGEGGGATCLVQHYNPLTYSGITRLRITANTIYVSTNVVQFFQIPNVFVLTYNDGFTAGIQHAFLFDAGITASYLGALLLGNEEWCSWSVHTNAADHVKFSRGPKAILAYVEQAGKGKSAPSKAIPTADKWLQIPGNSAGYGVSYSVTVGADGTYTANLFGAPGTGKIKGTSANFTDHYAVYYNTALNGAATGIYTCVFEVEVFSDAPVAFYFIGAGNSISQTLPKGRHIVCVPGYYVSGTTSQQVGIASQYINQDQSYGFSSIRIFSGRVDIDTPNTICYGSAAPGAGQVWEVGDRVIRVPAAAGQPKAWVCTTRGDPSVWTSEGNL